MHRRKVRSLLLAVLPMILLLALAGAASAQWTVNNVPRSWDDDAARWENGNMIMWLNTDPQPFYYSYGLGQGQDEFNTTPVANACVGGGSTAFAGTAALALDHTDEDGIAPGFQSTANWALVRCSALEGDPDTKYPLPADIVYTCTNDNADGDIDTCEIVSQDVVETLGCGGNCFDEIVTTVQVNLDLNCDGVLDVGLDDDVCLYWDAVKPPNTAPYYTNPLQVHIRDDQGEKTLNFGAFRGPNAVGLASFTASARAAGVNPVGFVLAAVAVGLVGLFLAWRSARG